MIARREFGIAIGVGLVCRRSWAATPRRLALLVAAPWEGESYLSDDLRLMEEALIARGLNPPEIISVLAPLDRSALLRHLDAARARMAGWPEGELFVYYNGHGMYGAATSGRPEPGLQLNRNRAESTSFLLWRDFFAALISPDRVRTMLLPDCCHTNLLRGRLPPRTAALIVRSNPQDSLNCRTGTALLGETPSRKRHGVISYYGARTLAQAHTAGEWLSSFNTAADRDVLQGKLHRLKRVDVVIEGDSSVRILGRRAQTLVAPAVEQPRGEATRL